MKRSTTLTQYPQLGQLVDFVVTEQKTGALIEAQGRVLAICMDGRKRTMAHLEYVPNPDAKPEVNVDLQCLNPSEEFKAKLTACLVQVMANSTEGNDAVKAIVEKHNTKNDALFDELLGDVVEFEQLPEPEMLHAAAGNA